MGYTALEVYSAEAEAGGDKAHVDSALTTIEEALPGIGKQVVAEWKRGANRRAALCWGTIFLAVFNWTFGFVRIWPESLTPHPIRHSRGQ